MKASKRVILCAVGAGILSGVFWFRFGKYSIEPIFDRVMTWAVLPVAWGVLMSIVLFLIMRKRALKSRMANSVLFLVLYYAFFWTPLYFIFVLCLIFGPR